MSQRGLAERIGLTPSHLNRIEHGSRRPPGVEKLLAMVATLRLNEAEAESLVSVAGYSPAILRAGGGLSYASPTLGLPPGSDVLQRLAALVERIPPSRRERCVEAIAALIESLAADDDWGSTQANRPRPDP